MAAYARVLAWIFDVFTVLLSVTDVVTDVLVLIEMRRLGYETLFSISLSIFALSQISYTVMFVNLFASDQVPHKKALCFLVVLPLAQFVPFFNWLESLHLAPVVHVMEKLGLEASDEPKRSDEKGFKEAIEGKLRSHLGFIMEAFVEAIPQAALTTIFIVVLGHASVASIFSVAISIVTIASKTYLLAFALDSLTFLSNFLCTIGDCFGLFATVTVLAGEGFQELPARSLLGLTTVGSAALALSLVTMSIHNIADDHLKTRHRLHWKDKVDVINYVFFDVYLVHMWSAILLVVPCTVALLSIRLSIVPLVIRASFGQKVDDDPAHMRFLRRLLRFIQQGPKGTRSGCCLPLSARARQEIHEEQQARLWRVNTFIQHARNHRSKFPSVATQKSMRDWVEKTWCPVMPAVIPSARVKTAGQVSNQSAIAGGGEASRRCPVIASMYADFYKWLTEEEEVCRKGRNKLNELRREFREKPVNALLWSVSWVTLIWFPACGALCFLCFVLLVPVSIFYPMMHVYPTCTAFAGGKVAAMLPCILTSSHLATLALVLLLAPAVARRQLDWLGLRGTHNLRRPFYTEILITEISRRHLLESMFQRRLGRNLTQYTFSFLESPIEEQAKSAPRVLGKPLSQIATAWEGEP